MLVENLPGSGRFASMFNLIFVSHIINYTVDESNSARVLVAYKPARVARVF